MTSKRKPRTNIATFKSKMDSIPESRLGTQGKEINELIPKAYKLYDDNHPVSKREIDKLITKLHRLRKENMEDDEKDDGQCG